MEIRPAKPSDSTQVAAMVARRVTWMQSRGLSPAHGIAENLATQADEARSPLWVLIDGAAVLGCTCAYDESPEWAFTADERQVPALFLASTWTVPNEHRLGHVLARWALDHAARQGLDEVRRGTFTPELVDYYTHVQGWRIVREVPRRGHVCTFLTRQAAPQDMPELSTARI